MKKALIASLATSALVFGSFAVSALSASAYVFSNNLSVGSTGADVIALQSWLVSKGFLTMPAGVSMGYFGSLTKAAVVSYQAGAGLPSTGFVGPMTRGLLNGGASVTMTPATTFTCPTGWTCQAPAGTVNVTPTNADGSISAQTSSYVSSGIQLKKGDTKDVVAVRLQATSGAVQVSRMDVHFNVRPWLIFSQITLHDSTGKVLATKTISSSNDATEITVGSDYLVRFDGLNYVVTPGVNPDLAVGVTVLAATDKITNGQVVNVGIGASGIRTINGKGYTDSVSGATFTSAPSAVGISTLTGVGASNFTLQSTGSVADIYARVSPNSLPTRQQVTSPTQTTTSVNLGTFSLKSANNSSTLNTFIASINAATTSAATTIFSNIRLVDGSNSYGGTLGTTANGATPVTFSNLTIALTQDAWHDLTLVADIAPAVSVVASSSLTANTTNIVVTDANYNTATIETAAPASNNITLTSNAVSVSNAMATLGSTIAGTNGITTGYNVNYTFTLTNNSNNDLFVSTTPFTFVGTSTSGTAGSSTLGTVIAVTSPSTYNGDAAGALDIPAGLSRTFTFNGAIRGTAGQSVQLKVTQINYGLTSGTPTGQNINFGLEPLSYTANF